jgi:FHA domain/zinc-ribbon domain
MATFTCPQGHESSDPEWCDVCGARIGDPVEASDPPAAPVVGDPSSAAGGAPAGAPPAASGTTTKCPHCGAQNEPDNLFCEECGYDFTTGQAPPEPAAAPAAPAEPSGAPWVAVVEVDPQWYALKGSLADTPCPPASTYTVAFASKTALIGRTSASRAVRPDIALDQDTGVSRRHAQLVNDGTTLTVIDLASTNGTFVVPVGEEPDDDIQPLAADEVRPLADGDRIYLGAWTRITVRKG